MRVPLIPFLCLIGIASAIAQPNIPVDLVTGSAQVTVPIGAISEGDLSVPIYLAYNATGVQPTKAGGTAGVNWSLVAGGSVRRELRGLPDDYFGTPGDATDTRRGWLANNNAQTINTFTPSSDDYLPVCSDELADWNFLNNMNYAVDTEPDVFSFSAPGLSGQFVFGSDNQPKLIPYQDVKIILTPTALNAPITKIEIIRNDGVKYTFDRLENATRQVSFDYPNCPVTQFTTLREQYRKPAKYYSAWNLTKIESPTGSKIDFCYGSSCGVAGNHYADLSASKKEFKVLGTNASPNSDPCDQFSITDNINSAFLASISSSSRKVEFFYYHPGLLHQVDIIDRSLGNKKIFKMGYASIKNTSEQRVKSFLKSVTEANSSCENFPSFEFDYYNVTYSGFSSGTTSLLFSDTSTVKQDLWGYFNNLAVSKNPKIYFFSGKTGAERYRYYPIPGQSPTSPNINGANRNVNPSTVMYGSLQKITYPTGGSATIVYEPNQYRDQEVNLDQYGPGLRVKQLRYTDPIGQSPDIIMDYEYKTTSNTSSGKMLYRSVFAYHDVDQLYAIQEDQSPQPWVMYERVTVKNSGSGKTVYEYLLPGMYPLTTASPDWNASKTKIARQTCVSVGHLKTEHFMFPFAVNTNFEFERGLPSKIEDFNESGSRVRERVYAYQRLGGSAVVVKGLKYEKLQRTTNLANGTNSGYNLFVYSHYSLLTNIGKVIQTETNRVWDMSNLTNSVATTTSYTFNSTHHLLSQISTTNSDNITHKTRYKYAKDFSTLTNPNTSDTKSVMLKKLNNDNRHGTIVETIQSINDGSETVTGASLVLFGNYPDSLGGIRALPAETRVFNGTTGFAEATVSPASGSNQVISYNGSVYRSGATIDKYDYIGNVLSASNAQKGLSSVHYGYKKSVPVAQFSNAAFNEALYAGFETYTGGEFNVIPSGVSYPQGWSGRKAIQLNSGASNALQRTNMTKGRGRYYRFSCRVLATAARQIYFRVYNGSTLVVTGTGTYSSGDANTWKYIEGRVDMNAAPATFNLKLEVNGITTLDDVAFYPELADFSASTVEPLIGKTSETGTRGTSSFYEYDQLGRLKYVKDQDKGIRQISDYYFEGEDPPIIEARISSSHHVFEVVKNATVNYTANTNANCNIAPLTYDWYVDGVKLGNNTTSFQYQYTQEKIYELKLVVTHPVYGNTENVITYDVRKIGSGPISVTVVDNSGTNAYAFCDANHTKTFTATLQGCYVLEGVDFVWKYLIAGQWYTIGNQTPGVTYSNDRLTLTFDPVVVFNGTTNMGPYEVKLELSTVCPLTGEPSSASANKAISYNSSTQCQ